MSELNLGQSIYPEFLRVGSLSLPLSGLVGTVVVLLLLLAAFFIRLGMKRWTEEPHGVQAVVELAVEAAHDFVAEKLGDKADLLAPFTLTFMAYIFFGTCVELFGVSPITKDINCTLALGLFSFMTVNGIALRVLGLKGRVRHLASPFAVVLPIKVLTDCVAPLSMALRLFANMLVGFLVMHLVYAFCPVILPGALCIYFTLIHAVIQCYVFGTLNLNYIQEALE